jgi:hypothetical protein
MRSGHSLYLATLGLTGIVALAGLATFNALVDPIGAYPTLHLRKLQAARNPNLSSRVSKAELVAHGDCDVLLLGSSRVQLGLPVHHPGFATDRVYNVGLDGTSLPEMSAVLDFALNHNHLKQVVFSPDFEFFSDRGVFPSDFDRSRFNPRLNLIEYHARNLLSGDATRASWQLLHHPRRSNLGASAERGLIPRPIPRQFAQRAGFACRISSRLAVPQLYGDFHYSSQRMELFRTMVQRCRDRGVQLIIFFPPVHALELETIRTADLWPVFEKWETDMTALISKENKAVPIWDFSGYTGPRAEAIPPPGNTIVRMKWYVDSNHFTPELGQLVLDRMFTPSADAESEDAFGVRLTPTNMQNHLRHLEAEREVYASTHADEELWLAGVARLARNYAPPHKPSDAKSAGSSKGHRNWPKPEKHF